MIGVVCGPILDITYSPLDGEPSDLLVDLHDGREESEVFPGGFPVRLFLQQRTRH